MVNDKRLVTPSGTDCHEPIPKASKYEEGTLSSVKGNSSWTAGKTQVRVCLG